MGKRLEKLTFFLLFTLTTLLCGCQPHEHSYGNWEMKVQATCSAEGMQVRICKCGDEQTKTIKRLEHDYGEWKTITEPTCAAEGEKEQSCKNCGEKNSVSIPKKDHIWQEATCASPKKCKTCGLTEGHTNNHTLPDSNVKCKACKQDVHASDYQYLAGSDFRGIRRDYNHAIASRATMIMYKDSRGDVCILLKVYYSIGEKDYNDLFLHNFTRNERITDPLTYYEKLKNRAFGAEKIAYMNIIIDIEEMELHMLKNEYTHTVSADYLNL